MARLMTGRGRWEDLDSSLRSLQTSLITPSWVSELPISGLVETTSLSWWKNKDSSTTPPSLLLFRILLSGPTLSTSECLTDVTVTSRSVQLDLWQSGRLSWMSWIEERILQLTRICPDVPCWIHVLILDLEISSTTSSLTTSTDTSTRTELLWVSSLTPHGWRTTLSSSTLSSTGLTRSSPIILKCTSSPRPRWSSGSRIQSLLRQPGTSPPGRRSVPPAPGLTVSSPTHVNWPMTRSCRVNSSSCTPVSGAPISIPGRMIPLVRPSCRAETSPNTVNFYIEIKWYYV